MDKNDMKNFVNKLTPEQMMTLFECLKENINSLPNQASVNTINSNHEANNKDKATSENVHQDVQEKTSVNTVHETQITDSVSPHKKIRKTDSPRPLKEFQKTFSLSPSKEVQRTYSLSPLKEIQRTYSLSPFKEVQRTGSQSPFKESQRTDSENIPWETQETSEDNKNQENQEVSEPNTIQIKPCSDNLPAFLIPGADDVNTASAPTLRKRNSEEVSNSEPNNNLKKKGRESNFSIVDDDDLNVIRGTDDFDEDKETGELDDIQRRGSFSASETISYSEATSLISETTDTQESEIDASGQTGAQKKSFLKRLKSFCKIHQKQIEVHSKYVYGFRTERTQQGIWLFKENQSDYTNPLGRMFTKKNGKEFNDLNRTTTYYCRNCRGSNKPEWPYGSNKVVLKLKNKEIISLTGEHNEHCPETTFKEIMAEECFGHSKSLSKTTVMNAPTTFAFGEEKLKDFARYFRYGLGELKTIFGEYYKRSNTLRAVSSRNAPKLKNGKIPEDLKTTYPMEDNAELLKFHILGEPGEDLIVLGTKVGLEVYNRSKIRMSDGTFYVCPPPYYQLYVVIAVLEENKNDEKRIEYLPVAFGLMKNRTENLYKKFWDTLLKEMKNYGIAHTEPDMFITDKEPAMIKSIEKLYPGKHIHCYFHQCQSIVRQLKSLGIVKYFVRLRKGNDNLENLSTFYEIFRKIIALPLLPENFITKKYKQLETELLFNCKKWMTKKELDCLKGWTKYLSNEWFCTSAKELKKISKFRKEIRNTNGSETTNKQINSSPYLRKRRGVVGVIMLCQKLDENVRLKEFNLERFKYEERFAFRPRNPYTVEKEDKLKKLQDELEESNFSDINTYLNDVADIFMPLKFKEMFREMVSMLEVSEAVLKKEEEDLSSEEKALIEDIFNCTISQTISEIGTDHKFQLTTSSGRKITPCKRYYNSDHVNF